MSDPVRSEEPTDRLTRLCDAMTNALEAHPEYEEGDKCVVFIDNEKFAGLHLFGYEDDRDAIAAIFTHLRALFRSHGSDLQIHSLGSDGTMQ